jgi:Ala-tRNA(Pro) deacylase
VLPAAHYVSERRLRDSLGAGEVRLASEDEYAEVCPGCEVGAAPPFGVLYGLPLYASPALALCDRITFNAGSHDCALRLSYEDFERVANPRIVRLSRQGPVGEG